MSPNHNVNDEAEENFRLKGEIRRIIKENVVREETLNASKEKIKNFIRRKLLSNLEEKYVEHKFIKYNQQEFLLQVPLTFSKIDEKEIEKLTIKVLQANELQNIPNHFSKIKQLELLLTIPNVFNAEKQLLLLFEFKNSFTSCLASQIVKSKEKQNFELFIKHLNKYLAELKSQFLQQEDFDKWFQTTSGLSDRDIFLEKLIQLILGIDESKYLNWEEYTKNIEDKKRKIFNSSCNDSLENLKQIIKKSLQDNIEFTPIQKTRLSHEVKQFCTGAQLTESGDEMKILKIWKQTLIMSKYVIQIEEWLEKGKENYEVQLIAETLFIDADLLTPKWQGKNIAIIASKIIVVGKLEWDFSGKHGESFDGKDAYSWDHPGASGSYGSPGENGMSGGNVCIIANQEQFLEHLKITSNGGNGGNGQNGGKGNDGKDGENGFELSKSKLAELFPSPSIKLGITYQANLKKVVSNINKELVKDSYQSQSSDCINSTTGVSENLKSGYIYIRGNTEAGGKIEFACSSCVGAWRHSLFLYKGAPGGEGKQGGRGGLGGLGGGGGFKGNIQILVGNKQFELSDIIALPGDSGNKGRDGWDGSCGKPGTNGRDIGYMDYAASWSNETIYQGRLEFRNSTQKRDDAIYYGKDGNWTWGYIANLGSPLKASVEQMEERTRDARSSGPVQGSRGINEKLLRQELQNSMKKANLNEQENLGELMNSQLKMLKEQIEAQQKKNGQIEKKINCVKEQMPERKYLKRNTKSFNVRLNEDLYHKNQENAQLLSMNQIGIYGMKKAKQFDEEYAIQLIEAPTVQDENSAFHCLFGAESTKGFFECQNFEEKQIEFFDKFKLNQFDEEDFSLFKMSLKSIFKSGVLIEDNHPKLHKYKNDFNANEIDWKICFEDEEVKSEYVEYLRNPNSFSKFDFALLAHLFGIKIQLYSWNPQARSFKRMQISPTMAKDFDNKDLTVIPIYLTGENHFCKLEYKKVRDFSNRNNFFNQTMNEYLNMRNNKTGALNWNGIFFKSNISEKEFEKIKIKETPAQLIASINEFINYDNFEGGLMALVAIPAEILYFLNLRISLSSICESSLWAINLFCSFLRSALVAKEDLRFFKWIAFALPFDKWVNELVLMKMEELYEEEITLEILKEWRENVESIKFKLILKIFSEKLEELKGSNKPFMHILKSLAEDNMYDLTSAAILSEISLSEWNVKLKQLHAINFINSMNYSKEEEKEKSRAIYYICSIQNESELLLNKFIKVVQKASRAYGDKSLKPRDLTEIIGKFYRGNWHLNEEILLKLEKTKPKDWIKTIENITPENGLRSLKQIINLISQDSNTTFDIAILSKIDHYLQNDTKGLISSVLSIFKSTKDEMEDKTKFSKTIKEKVAQFKETKSCEEKDKIILNFLNFVDYFVEKHFKFKLRETQKICILAFVLPHDSKENSQSLLAQVSTGEGKSLIVVGVMIIKALLGQSGDVITSSHILAKRDAEEYKKIYEEFGISVAHNASENPEERKDAYEKKIVYGEVSSFQRDYLLDQFYDFGQNKIRGNRKFENVMVDEVDSMLLDKGNSVLYLSHQPPDLDALENVFVFIWKQTVQLMKKEKDLLSCMKVTKVIILEAMFPSIQKSDLEFISNKDENIDQILVKLKGAGIINQEGIIQITGNVEDKIGSNICANKNALCYLIEDKLSPPDFIRVPNYLKKFVKLNLEKWIMSALKAATMEENVHYTVDVDRTNRKVDLGAGITIIDLDTGIDQGNSQWNEGLHQFLQMKHGCKISLLNLKAVFVSNISFFKLYSTVCGLTGTIGSSMEREFLKSTYDVNFLTVPLAISKKFIENEPIICQNEIEWTFEIFQSCTKIISEERSILVICFSVKEAEKLYDYLSEKEGKWNLEIYKRSYETFETISSTLEQGNIIIATNLAGRGTDIKISENLKKNGGLHVCLTFLPSNIRVEQQAFGRAARKGENGSGQLIFIDKYQRDNLGNEAAMTAIDLKMERDNEEMLRISEIKNHYENTIQKEEELFKIFSKFYSNVKRDIELYYKNDSKSIQVQHFKSVLLHWLLDKWAFWLDSIGGKLEEEVLGKLLKLLEKEFEAVNEIEIQSRKFKHETEISYKVTRMAFPILYGLMETRSLLVSLEGYYDSTHSLYMELVDGIAHLTKIGKFKIHKKEYTEAKKYFDRIVQLEPFHSIPAKYYNTFVLVKETNLKNPNETQQFVSQLKEVEVLLEEEVRRQVSYSNIITDCKNKFPVKGFIQVNGFEEQKQRNINILRKFIDSINSFIGTKYITPELYIGTHCDEDMAEHIYDHLLKNDILVQMTMSQNIDLMRVKEISQNFGLGEETLKTCLDSLKGKKLSNYNDLKILNLPSRTKFWKILIENKIIENEETFLIVRNDEIIPEVDSTNSEKISLPDQNKKNFAISLYDENMKQKNITKEELAKSYELLELKKKGKIVKEKSGIINYDELLKFKFPEHFEVNNEAFTVIPRINIEESKEIFKILVESGFIDSVGVLSFNSNTDKQIEIKFGPQYSIYKEDIMAIIKSNSQYRIEQLNLLNQMKNFLKEKEGNKCLRLSLPVKPEKGLMYELIDSEILLGVKMNEARIPDGGFVEGLFSKPCEWGKWAISLFGSTTIMKNELKDFFEFKLTAEEEQTFFSNLWDDMVNREWIKETWENVEDLTIRVLNLEALAKLKKNPIAKIMLDFKKEPKELKPEYRIYEKTLKMRLKLKVNLADEKFMKGVFATSQESLGVLRFLETKDGHLSDLSTEFSDQNKFFYCEELENNSLNGFDHLINLTEMSYTLKMWISTIAIVLIGIGQICLGTWLAFYSMGFGTFVSQCLISEGINDILYGVQAARSGHFSWRDWADHKWNSIGLSIISVTAAGIVARGIKYSKFGVKLGGDGWINKIGTKLHEALAGGMVEGVAKSGWTAMAKSAGYKIAQGLSAGVSSIVVNEICNRMIRTLLQNISTLIIENVNKGFDETIDKTTINELYNLKGKNETMRIIKHETNLALNPEWEKSIQGMISLTFSTIMQGIQMGKDKKKLVTNNSSNTIKYIQNILTTIDYSKSVWGMFTMTNEFLKETNKNLKIALGKAEKEEEIAKKENDKKSAKAEASAFKEFEFEVKNYWKGEIKYKLANEIETKLVKPLLMAGASALMQYVGRQGREYFKRQGEKANEAKLSSLIARYEEIKEDAALRNSDVSDEKLKNISKEMLSLLCQTRDPDMYARIVSATNIIPGTTTDLIAIAEHLNIRIEIESTNGDLPQTLNESGTKTIKMKLTPGDNANVFPHWESQSCPNQDGSSDVGDMNCMFRALNQELEHIGLGGNYGKENLIEAMRNSPEFRRYVKNGWASTHAGIGGFGGYKYNKNKKKSNLETESSDEFNYFIDLDLNENEMEDKIREDVLTKLAKSINDKIFERNHAEIMKSLTTELIDELKAEKRFDTVAVKYNKETKEIMVAGNIKKREFDSDGNLQATAFGFEKKDLDIIEKCVEESKLEIGNVKLIRPKGKITSNKENARTHAEIQLLKKDSKQNSVCEIHCSKNPCRKCSEKLDGNIKTSNNPNRRKNESPKNWADSDEFSVETATFSDLNENEDYDL